MIKIKAFYGDWQPATKEQTYKFCKTFIAGAINMTQQQKIEALNKNHLRGITYEQLIKEVSL